MEQEEYTYEPHNFSGRTPGNAYVHCVKCGHVMMKHPFSQWTQKVGCNANLHPSYSNQRAKTSPFGLRSSSILRRKYEQFDTN